MNILSITDMILVAMAVTMLCLMYANDVKESKNNK